MINKATIPQTFKLSELKKFCKEVDKELERTNISHKKITELKAQLHEEIVLSEIWKEKYTAIKRYE